MRAFSKCRSPSHEDVRDLSLTVWGTNISSHDLVVVYGHILNIARLTSYLYVEANYSDLLKYESVTNGSEVTFQVNHLIHLVALMLWGSTDCKVYFGFS